MLGLIKAPAVVCAALAGATFAQVPYDPDWQSRYKVGESVQFSVTGNEEDFQPCVVTENFPEAVMRVRCKAFKRWDAGVFIVHNYPYVRKAGARATVRQAAAKPAPAAARAGGSLRTGEYACYGSGGRIMIGLGFKVLPGGRYTDLDGRNPGRFSVSGTTVSFQGGHLGGKAGRNLRNGSFAIGAQAECEPF